MSDFSFVHNSFTKQWTVLAPKRSNRPDEGKHTLTPICPFCNGREIDERSIYQVPEDASNTDWKVRVINNKYPFAPIHEVIIHSQDHHKNIDELSEDQTQLILQVFRQRYNVHKEKGTVYIMHNHGEAAGESLPHPHSQLVVIPKTVDLSISPLVMPDGAMHTTRFFSIFCPNTSSWPDEVWITPSKQLEGQHTAKHFGDITDEEIEDLAHVLKRTIEILDLRHGHEFPFNFYIYPYTNWYIRIIPRQRRLGGFEVGTGIYVLTQDPAETIAFIKEHFDNPNKEKILTSQQADYRKGV